MRARNAVLIGLALTLGVALFVASRRSSKRVPASPEPAGAALPAASQPAAPSEPKVPPYHASAMAARPLPKTLPASRFSIPAVAKAYGVAQAIPEVLAQQPCYCWCDKFGHGSLLDCFRTDHGAG